MVGWYECRWIVEEYPPGWQVNWEGWKELQAMVCGADAVRQLE